VDLAQNSVDLDQEVSVGDIGQVGRLEPGRVETEPPTHALVHERFTSLRHALFLPVEDGALAAVEPIRDL
jgi:hypothetical protein